MKELAIALCRVSTPEQTESNSLHRQREAVLKAAEELEVIISDDGWWSGDMSSKAGTNVDRKDLKEMQEYCKQNKRVKYLIVDEPDRFMRSIDEAFYFEVLFRQLGVKVWYASDPYLNTGDLNSKMLKFSKYFPAEGSNVERIHKSIVGQEAALRQGRYTFSPKPGYKRGYERGIQEIHEIRGPALQKVLVRLSSRLVTPSRALIELNESDFMVGHAPYKMDKFRKIVTDPFYAGIVEINKQVKVRNEAGLHEPLITKEQHLKLIKIMNAKQKNQAGPRKNGNPEFPCNNIVNCDGCRDKRNGRVVGFRHGNGKPNSKRWLKYRCRSCGLYLTRDELHAEIERQFSAHTITEEAIDELMKALSIVWKKREDNNERERLRLSHKIRLIQATIGQQLDALSDPSNKKIRDDLRNSITKKKEEIKSLSEELDGLDIKDEANKEGFLRFAFRFLKDIGQEFLSETLLQENRLRCKQIMFPGGFYFDAHKKVYTPEISPLIRLATNKKDAEASNFSHLVRVMGL